jgi:vacuolar iron transporter family protein
MLGGLIPMIPYFAIKTVNRALIISICITVVILLVFGYLKARFTVPTQRAAIKSALQTLMIGAAAAGASYAIVRAVDRNHLKNS